MKNKDKGIAMFKDRKKRKKVALKMKQLKLKLKPEELWDLQFWQTQFINNKTKIILLQMGS